MDVGVPPIGDEIGLFDSVSFTLPMINRGSTVAAVDTNDDIYIRDNYVDISTWDGTKWILPFVRRYNGEFFTIQTPGGAVTITVVISSGATPNKVIIPRLGKIKQTDVTYSFGNLWAGENLDVTTYRNGNPLIDASNYTNQQWFALTEGAWCYPNNQINYDEFGNKLPYGRLYNSYAVNDPRGLAPVGFRIPTETEWNNLITSLGGESSGVKMSAEGDLYWIQNDLFIPTNTTGLTILPAGNRSTNKTLGFVNYTDSFKYSASFWASKKIDGNNDTFTINSYNNRILSNYYSSNKKNGLSVRCVVDEIVSSGLLVHLDAANTNSYSGSGTTWKDLTGNGYNGRLMNPQTFDSESGGSLVFNGITNRVTFGIVPSTLRFTNNLTITVWLKFNSLLNPQTIISCNEDAGYGIVTNGVRMTSHFWLNGSFTPTAGETMSAYDTTSWVNITTTFNGSVINFYRNGKLIDSVSKVGNITYTYFMPLLIGANPTLGPKTVENFFNGKISRVLMYNRALSSQEIIQNYDATKGRYGLSSLPTSGLSSSPTPTQTPTNTPTPTSTIRPTIPSVLIYNQEWSSVNLNVSTYRDGARILQATTEAEWVSYGNDKIGAWRHLDDNPANDAIYGKLYNWFAVNDYRGLAPAGYHIPTDDEWAILINNLGGDGLAGGKMKSTSTLWQQPNAGVTNSSGFSALPGGYIYSYGYFFPSRLNSSWWSSTDWSITNAYNVELRWSDDNVYRYYLGYDKKYGFSVRLIKD